MRKPTPVKHRACARGAEMLAKFGLVTGWVHVGPFIKVALRLLKVPSDGTGLVVRCRRCARGHS